MIQAVARGLSQSENASYAQKKRATRATLNHLLRSRLGQWRLAGSQRLASVLGARNGQAMHETLPTASNPRTTNPRQWTHGKTPARFIAETRGPSSPSAITTPGK